MSVECSSGNTATVEFQVSCVPPAPGSKIALASDRSGTWQFYLAEPDGSNLTPLTVPFPLYPEGRDRPILSPDATRIAFIHHETYWDGDLWVQNVDGSGSVNLTPGERDGGSFSWSPDGSRIAFHLFYTNLPDGQQFRNAVANADGTGLIELTDWGNGLGAPDWSPDGSSIVFAATPFYGGRDGIWVINADGTGLRQITTGGLPEDVEDHIWDRHPRWSPDGTRIVFNHIINPPGGGPTEYEVHVVNADGTEAEKIAGGGTDRLSGPRWTPDGTRIVAYDFGAPGERAWRIASFKADGTDLVRTPAFDAGFDWAVAPDGSKIALGIDLGSGGSLYTMNLDGSELHQLTFDGLPGQYLLGSWGG
jgi:Tol biopolymer transport system component